MNAGRTPARTLLASMAAVAFVAVTVAFAPAASVRIGEPAPGFTLRDVEGKTHSLADHKGKIVVLQWFNPECPFIGGVYGQGVVKKTLAAAKKADDVVFLAIDSSADRTERQVRDRAPSFLKEHGVEHPVLIDHAGTVGRAYDARTTPHIFIIDAKGVLRYMGAFTDDPTGNKRTATNYVIRVIEQLRKGAKVSPDKTRPWGCSVKYAR